MSVMDELMSVLDGLRTFVEEIPTGGNVAGLPEDCRRAACHWRAAGTAIDTLHGNLQSSLSAHIQTGPGGNWNDPVQAHFEAFWMDVAAGLQEQAAHCRDMAKMLDDSAVQMDAFNQALDAILIEIAIWIAATIILWAIPVAGEVEAVGATARGVTLIARGGMIVRRVLLMIRTIALVFGRAPRAARAVRLLEKAAKLEEGARAARLARGASLIAKVRDWRSARLLEKAADAWDVAKIQKAELAIQAYRASWLGRLRIAANMAKSERLLNAAQAAQDAGRAARAARLLDRAVQSYEDARNLPRASTFYKLWSAYRLNSIAGYTLRNVDKAGLDPHHDPTKGWRSFEALQIMGGSAFFTLAGFPVAAATTAFAARAGSWLSGLLGGAMRRSPTAGYWLGGMVDRVPGVVTSGMSAYSGPVLNGAWASINLTWVGERSPDLPRDVSVAIRSAGQVSTYTALPGNTLMALIRPGGLPGGAGLVLPVVWTTSVAQELTSPSIRAARGVVSGSPLDSMLHAVDFAVPSPGAFPVATLPNHLVVPGDNLWNIAAGQYGSGLYYPDIARRNHLPDPNVIQPGQRLTLPPVDPNPPSPPPAPPPPAAAAQPYAVRNGDSLWSIAQRAYGDGSRWRDIAAANGLHGTVIHQGERLWIPPLRRAG
jgi:LysM repeat protein